MTRDEIYEKLVLLFFWVGCYFAPTGTFLMLVGFFIIADLVTGILAAMRRGEAFRSKKLFRTVSKYIAYSVAILVAYVVNRTFFPDFPALQLMGGFIAFIEIKSIDENIYDITGYSLFKLILDKMKPKDDAN